ncbi:hypothetical protein CK203_107302 [Vitis vinifera]|uniref:Uncharacterized protein n=1 Tax=Vitis vinifera TaxID=29760 RepID=A0A438CH47_VITVI|nr:hypothetical protein CK203_107302 [Vitis vinifera]
MFGSTMEMTDIRAMKTCIALSWISWIPAWPECHFDFWVGGRLVRGSNQSTQSGQTSVQRDMDPQYATVDQLAKITDTMVSLRDVILRLGQRIDEHQAPLLDYTVPPLPPPLVQSAPQIGAFVLHGQTETRPHSIVAPAQVADDTQACIERIEQRMRSLHVTDGVMSWMGMMTCLLQLCRLSFLCWTLRDARDRVPLYSLAIVQCCYAQA